ncbi:hypothetical protein CECT5772_04441 [Streptococcus equi subsp. ruminatorum CECT 5772]|uniref:Uncharacterized protein n=1 Tax=Streptococcus equi subsp. ruminatorum CECT 5772 TaxID=1051981 RepID=A0A922NUM9_9STRE|nr:hypothetical protein CECT5772_04441 [Streptococcus equi subsp. ruminatorum CECT 5772]
MLPRLINRAKSPQALSRLQSFVDLAFEAVSCGV